MSSNKPSVKKVILGTVIVALVAVTGVILLTGSHAATPFAAAESESGTVAAPATKLTDSTASAGSAVKFAAGTVTPPTNPGGFQANCYVKPSACGYPDVTNTGVPAGVTLSSSGSVTASTNGQVIQNLNITNGQIVVKANNVTIKNVKITGCTFYPIDYGDNTGLIVQDTEINSTCTDTTAGMSFGNYTAIRVNVHGAADGFKANSNSLIQDSYIHDLAATASSHNDGIQTTGGSNVKFIHNTCDNHAHGVCIQFGPSDSNWTVSNNLMWATGWAINGSDGTKNSSFTGNRFVKVAGWYGPASSLGDNGNTWSGNYYDNDGSTAN